MKKEWVEYVIDASIAIMMIAVAAAFALGVIALWRAVL